MSAALAGGWEATAELSPTAGTGEPIGVVVAVIEEIVVVEANVAPGDAELFPEEPAWMISKAHNGKDTVLVVGITDDPVEEGKVILKFRNFNISWPIHRRRHSENRSLFCIRLNPVRFILK